MRSGSLVAAALALIAVLIAALVCFTFPLTANPGPESAQVLGVVGGVALALLQAVRSASRKPTGFLSDAIGGLLVAAGMLGIFVVVTSIGAAVRPSCNPARGYLPFFFLSVPVLVLHTAIGTWVGRLLGRAKRALFFMLLLEAGFAAALFVGWYREPGFRLISHLFVVVSGDLLRGAEMPALLVGFRAATLLFGLALICLGAARYPRIRRQGLSLPMSSPALVALAACALAVGLAAHFLSVDELMPSRKAMEAEYSLVKKRGALVVHADPIALRPKDVDAVLAEGTLWLDRIALRLGQRPADDVHVWLHATREAQTHWTGAAHVDFTLPWRREIHVVGADVPHGTLGHEIAHAVAGELSDTMLKVPSDFVVLQHAAVVEGVAVFLTQELAVRSGLTLKEQAAAMKKAGFAPDTATLFDGLRFFTEPPARAYVAAGAFIESLGRLPDPTKAIADLYRTGSLEVATGSPESAEELVRAHDAMLDGLTLPPDAAAVAAEAFRRPSILREVCEPNDAEHARSVRALVRTGDFAKALVDLEAGGPVTRATLDDLLVDAVDVDDPEALALVGERLEALRDKESVVATQSPDQAQRTDDHGDALWLAGRRRDAMATWDRVDAQELPMELQRNLLVKRALGEHLVHTGHNAPVGAAALDVLMAAKPDERAAAFERLHYWLGVDDGSPADLRHEPRVSVELGRYVHARRMVLTGALAEGARQFRRIVEEQMLEPVFLEQAALGLATALAKQGRASEASEILMAAADKAERPAVRLLMRDRAERAERAAAAPEKPARVTATSDPAWADRLLLGVEPHGDL